MLTGMKTKMSSATTTEREQTIFADFDDKQVYDGSRLLALDPKTRNFVVEFGKDAAQIAFDLSSEDVEDLLTAKRVDERPVRWM